MATRVLPKVGDIIVTNYGACHCTVASVTKVGDTYSITYTVPPRREPGYLNDYVVVDGRCRRISPWPKESSGYSSNRGGRNGDGYDEITIVSLAEIPRGVTMDLFAELEPA